MKRVVKEITETIIMDDMDVSSERLWEMIWDGYVQPEEPAFKWLEGLADDIATEVTSWFENSNNRRYPEVGG
jgi:hypothetical protein